MEALERPEYTFLECGLSAGTVVLQGEDPLEIHVLG
jgi:hypothetical protein